MQVGLRHFDSQTLDWLAGALRTGGLSRHALGRGLCVRTGWCDVRGKPCLSAAAKALPVLAARLGLELPPPCAVPDPTAVPAVTDADVPDTAVACALEDLGPVWLDPVGGAGDRRLWEAMMAHRHPRGWARPPGGQVRYWIRAARHGVLGGIGFGSAAWRLAARDAWIGWSAEARAANIGRVVCNHRFLLLGGVRVDGLASEVLRRATARVADDWEGRSAVRPVVAYTHVGPEHSGYCYHRAGWSCAGRGSGRRSAAGTVRVRALEDGWRAVLRHVERRPVGALAGAYDGMDIDWAQREYGRSGHTDGRIRRRIVDMGRAWLENMGEELPVIFPVAAAKTAAYRLLSNPGVSMDHILEPHVAATADRCRGEPIVLAIQDTTTLNDTRLEATEGLVELGGGGRGSVGVRAHAGLLVRASRSAKRRVQTPDGRERCLWAHTAARPAIAVSELVIPAAGGPRARKARTARLEIRVAEVTLLPPQEERKRTKPLTMRAISATETDAPDGTEPLHWLLLTTARPAQGETDAVHATTVLDWDRKRGTVETWFKTLKSGTRITDRRLDAADDLRKCLAFDAVTACHVADITMRARERPETPATDIYPERDVRLLLTLLAFQGHREIFDMTAGMPPDIRTFVVDLGRLVGAHPTKRQPLPGVKTVWQGLERLNWGIQVRDAIGEKQLE